MSRRRRAGAAVLPWQARTMRLRTYSMGYWVLSCALAAVGCGDDVAADSAPSGTAGEGSPTEPEAGGSTDPGGSSNGGSAGASGVAGTGGGGASTAGVASILPDAGAGALQISCDVDGEGACQNEVDCPALQSGEAAQGLEECATCLLSSDPTCWATCLADSAGLTAACSGCVADLADCALANCAVPCLPDVLSEVCLQCQADSGCSADFEACSGVVAL